MRILFVSPGLDQLDGGRGQQLVRQQVDFFHDVGQTHGKLLAKEGKRRALAGVGGTWRTRQNTIQSQIREMKQVINVLHNHNYSYISLCFNKGLVFFWASLLT